jgi:hypothetical protein
MIFTASDIDSLSRSLSRWEWAEYISEAFVIVACAGEFIADLDRPWLTTERKHHLERRSTILLVAALSASLVCLIRTNELSGNVIGFLGQKAEEAGGKAKVAIADSSTAMSQAKDALTKAGMAQQSLGKAEQEASGAESAASNALTMASGARKEADSFEKDIVSAKTQATNAESHLAEALRQATAATYELNRLKTPRSLVSVPVFVTALKEFRGTEYTFASVFADDESIDLLRQLDGVLQLAGWKRVAPGGAIVLPHVLGKDVDFGVPPGTGRGVSVSVDSLESVASLQSHPLALLPTLIRAAVALNNNISASLVPSQKGIHDTVEVESGNSTTVRISVGKKP